MHTRRKKIINTCIPMAISLSTSWRAPAQISLTLSSYMSLSSIALGRSFMHHLVSVQSCCRQVLAGYPTLAHLFEGFHRSTSLMSLLLLFQQCPACFVHLSWMVFKMGDRCPYSCYFVRCCLQDLFNTACSILVQLLSSFLSYA